MSVAKNLSEASHTPEWRDGWAKPLTKEEQERFDRMVESGFCSPDLKIGPKPKFEPLEIPGFSLTDLLLRMREEERPLSTL